MKIVTVQIFDGDPDALMGPEWEARIEGRQNDLDPFGIGSTAERAIADLKDNFCPCDCLGNYDASCVSAEACKRTWDDA